jgi:hypothetical protein
MSDIDTLAEWAGWKAWHAADVSRSNLEIFRRLHESYGDCPEFAEALRKLNISDKLMLAYVDASNLLRERGF